MAHTVSQLLGGAQVPSSQPPPQPPSELQLAEGADKVLVVCGASHIAYNLGVPERVFAAHPALKESCYRIYAREVDAERSVLGSEGLQEVFGPPGNDPADVAFVYEVPQ